MWRKVQSLDDTPGRLPQGLLRPPQGLGLRLPSSSVSFLGAPPREIRLKLGLSWGQDQREGADPILHPAQRSPHLLSNPLQPSLSVFPCPHSLWHCIPLPQSSHSQHTPAPRTFARFRASPSRASPKHLPSISHAPPVGFPSIFCTTPVHLPRISLVSSIHSPAHLPRLSHASPVHLPRTLRCISCASSSRLRCSIL